LGGAMSFRKKYWRYLMPYLDGREKIDKKTGLLSKKNK
jgi:hypothetical protein